ncbi:MAG: PAS domain S-box protein, partial [Bacillota bacterium]
MELISLPVLLSLLQEKILSEKVVFFKKNSTTFFLDESRFLQFLVKSFKDGDFLITWSDLEGFVELVNIIPSEDESNEVNKSIFGIKSDSGDIIGWVFSTEFYRYRFIQEKKQKVELELVRGDLETILDSSYDVIFVADGSGKTLRVSAACENIWGFKEEELVGKSVFELEKRGIFYPSATRQALEKKERILTTQTTKQGKRLLVVSTPRFNPKGEIIRVV